MDAGGGGEAINSAVNPLRLNCGASSWKCPVEAWIYQWELMKEIVIILDGKVKEEYLYWGKKEGRRKV